MNQQVYIYHSLPKKKPGASRKTVVGVIDNDMVRIGVAQSFSGSKGVPHDNFCRRTGRVKAEGRARSKNPLTILPVAFIDSKKAFIKYATQLCGDPYLEMPEVV